ncbi:hypothetical protein BDY21DRAFT_356862 [Lineolata rhizophorae]|uniref:Uncharacterized protein n=1 Tax=Lineolata rhizophorae TaxID=578093 RepID=A0A6A6NN87_9PEZI|nr:hypothetical protein BDY21DRAFT_356862 [Lineolata rhizophorae]
MSRITPFPDPARPSPLPLLLPLLFDYLSAVGTCVLDNTWSTSPPCFQCAERVVSYTPRREGKKKASWFGSRRGPADPHPARSPPLPPTLSIYLSSPKPPRPRNLHFVLG